MIGLTVVLLVMGGIGLVFFGTKHLLDRSNRSEKKAIQDSLRQDYWSRR